MDHMYLMPDENGVWHKVEPIFWEEGKEAEAMNKAFAQGFQHALKRVEESGYIAEDLDTEKDELIISLEEFEKLKEEQHE